MKRVAGLGGDLDLIVRSKILSVNGMHYAWILCELYRFPASFVALRTPKAWDRGSQGPYQLEYGARVFASGSAIKGLTAGAYTVNIISVDGCIVESVQAALMIGEDPSCEEFIMPNAFTPNGDGINETIKPVHSSLIREMRCYIFNRYGQRVYSYNGRGAGWDGNFGGKPQPAGNYIWLARYVSNRGEIITRKGSFMLIR